MTERNKPDAQSEVVIYRDQELIITVSQRIAPAAVELLVRTIYGTSGIRYQHTNQTTKIQDLGGPLFFHLRIAGQLVGTYCLDERILALESSQIVSFYGRYLAVDQQESGKGYGRLLKQKAIEYIEQNTPSPLLFYSFIEEKNSRSMAISNKQGFQSIATLRTYFFRRYAPKKDPRLRIARADELGLIKDLLRDFYANYSFKTFAHIGYQDQYFVLKEADQIVAGIQANPVVWRFHQMSGIKGWILMNLVPRLGVSRRFFNPAHNSFLVLEGLFFKEGRDELMPVLLESVLAHFDQHSAMWEIDEKDPLVALLKQKSMGILSGFQGDVKTHVLVKAIGLLDQDQHLLSKSPLYVSCFDYS